MMMNQDEKCYLCKFCNMSFRNGKQLGGHMRCHLALISASRKQGIQEFINGEKGIDLNCRKQESDDEKWIVLSSKAVASHKRCKVSIKNDNVCEKCGKGFDSVKALYGHMRCHSVKRLDESKDGVARKKRSRTRYKSFDDDDDEVVQGAICLIMLSRGLRDVISNRAESSSFSNSTTIEKNVEFEVSLDAGFKNKNDIKEDAKISVELNKRRSKCVICFKEFASGQALGSHKRIHNKPETKGVASRDIFSLQGNGFVPFAMLN